MIRYIRISDALPGASQAAFTVQTTFGSSGKGVIIGAEAHCVRKRGLFDINSLADS